MIQDLKVLAIIPARAGSKGIENKNITPLNGKPLIWYSISEALKSNYIDDVIVSTDSKEIADVAKECGAQVPFLRPGDLASDDSRTSVAVAHAVNQLKENGKEYNIIVLLQPTQPLRTVEDIDNAIDTYMDNGKKSVVSISEADDHPIFMRTVQDNKMEKIMDGSSTCRRQDLPKVYKVNGCIYVNDISEINDDTSFNDNEIPFIMEKDHSIDIDDYSDIALAEYYLNKNN